MRTGRVLFALATVVVVLAGDGGSRVAVGGGQEQLGQPFDRLTLEQRRLFNDGLAAFSASEDAADGLGPIFNAASCAACHFAPAVGGSSPTNETRAARLDNGTYSELAGGSLFQVNAISPNCAEVVPAQANVIAQRQTTPLFGLGLIEAIPDGQIEVYAASQARFGPRQAGRVNMVRDPVTATRRVGRFGWKAQQATLLAFSGDAYVNEMGITSRLFPAENAPNGDTNKLAACDTVPDPEDKDDDITHFTNFMRLLAPPARDSGFNRRHAFGRGHDPGRRDRGERVFERVGCEGCHHAGYRAISPIAAINGERVDAYSDFLLHDVGTGDGIVQGNAQGNEFRTPPLWGVTESAPYLHDGSAATIRDAIGRHTNQGDAARRAFERLSPGEQEELLDFLDSI